MKNEENNYYRIHIKDFDIVEFNRQRNQDIDSNEIRFYVRDFVDRFTVLNLFVCVLTFLTFINTILLWAIFTEI